MSTIAGKIPANGGTLQRKNIKKEEKTFTFPFFSCIIYKQTSYGGAPDSIAGERKDKHTVDGTATIKRST